MSADTARGDNLALTNKVIPTVAIPFNNPTDNELYPEPSNYIHAADKGNSVPASLSKDVPITHNTRPLPDQSNSLLTQEIVKGVPKSVPKCDRYCSVFKHGLASSIKQGYDDWCEINCRQGFCPLGTCTCNCHPVRRRIVCEAMDLRFKMNSIGSQWCNSVCTQGFCPKHYCKCRVEMDSTYVPA